MKQTPLFKNEKLTYKKYCFAFPIIRSSRRIHIYNRGVGYTLCKNYHKTSLKEGIRINEKNVKYLCKVCKERFFGIQE